MEKNIYHWLILTGVPYENSGGGQRAAQIAKKLFEHGHEITYVYAMDYIEKNSAFILPKSPNFRTAHVNKFSPYNFIKNLNKMRKLVILVEVPHFSFLSIINRLEKYSFKIIYETIDPWDTELGKGWYDKKIETTIIKKADILTATASSLKTKLEKNSKKIVHLLPNAYDDKIFNLEKEYLKPLDLPPAPIIIYIGALWGSWFDIDMVVYLGRSLPNYNFVLIGEYNGQYDEISPSNIYFPGLKPQSQLPAYLLYSNIGIIPFKINRLTEGVNPLKVYEYLAMGLTVVSTPMEELKEIPNVFLANSKTEFSNTIKEILTNNIKTQNIENWLKNHNWEQRVEKLISLL